MPAGYRDGLVRARQLLQQGQIEAAYLLLSELVKVWPVVAEIHDALAIALIQKREFLAAENHFRQATQIEPGNAFYHCNYGNVLQSLKNLDAAIVQFKWAIQLDTTMADAHYNLANAYALKLEWGTAIECYNVAIRLRPAWPLAYLNRANAWAALGDDAAALFDYGVVAELSPGESGVYLNRAKVYFGSNQLSLALEDCRRGLGLAPTAEDLQWMLVQVLLGLGQAESIVSELVEKYQVNKPRAYSLLGAAYSDAGQINLAIEALERSLTYDDGDAEALGLLGQCKLVRGQYKAAIQLCRKAIECNSDSVLVRQNLIHAHQVCAEFEEAIEVNQMIALSERSLGTSFFLKQNLSDWSHYETELPQLDFRLSHLDEVAAIEDPWSLFSVCEDPAILKAVARRYIVKYVLPLLRGKKYTNPPPSASPVICIGYFSPDFKVHAVSHLLRQLIMQHDRNKFKVIAFSYGRAAPGDEMRKILESTFDEFVDVELLTDDEVRALAVEKGVEIAVDLGGLTGEVRPGLFARRLAPVQINFLGFVGTCGTPWHDYVIADPTVVPPEHLDSFTEKVVHLPMYMPYDTDLNRAAVVSARAEHGLPPVGFVFCCFNNNFKITPTVFDMWMRILKAVPGSCLWLRSVDKKTRQRLLSRAEGSGIESARLVFAPSLPSMKAHLARYRLADLFLDTFPYGAHATAMDAIWMGLPVLTRMGAAMHSRVSASLLKSVGLEELVAGTAEDYEQMAIGLALSPDRIESLKEKLMLAHAAGNVFPMTKYTRNFERALAIMSERCRQGQPPIHFSV